MNNIKILMVMLVSLCMTLVFVPAHAADGYWVENPNLSVEFFQGNDWGKLNFNHTELTPRDGECDGHEVVFYLRKNTGGTFTYREIRDQNGCDVGGGSGTIDPYYWDTVKLCEYVGDGTSYCTPVYNLPWGN